MEKSTENSAKEILYDEVRLADCLITLDFHVSLPRAKKAHAVKPRQRKGNFLLEMPLYLLLHCIFVHVIIHLQLRALIMYHLVQIGRIATWYE